MRPSDKYRVLVEVVLLSLESFAGYCLWSALSFALWQFYAFSLARTAGALWSIAYLALALGPAAGCAHRAWSRLLLSRVHLVRAAAVALALVSIVGNHYVRAAFASLASFALLGALGCTFLPLAKPWRLSEGIFEPPGRNDQHLRERRERLWLGTVAGVLAGMAIRACNATMDPMYEYYGSTIGVALCGVVVLLALEVVERYAAAPRIIALDPSSAKGETAVSLDHSPKSPGAPSTPRGRHSNPMITVRPEDPAPAFEDAPPAPRFSALNRAVVAVDWLPAGLALSGAFVTVLFAFTTSDWAPEFLLSPTRSPGVDSAVSLALLLAYALGIALVPYLRKASATVWALEALGLGLVGHLGNGGGLTGAFVLALATPCALLQSIRQAALCPVPLAAALVFGAATILLVFLSLGVAFGNQVPVFGYLVLARPFVLAWALVILLAFTPVVHALRWAAKTHERRVSGLVSTDSRGLASRLFLPSARKSPRPQWWAFCATLVILVAGLQAWRVGVDATGEVQSDRVGATGPFSVMTYNVFQSSTTRGKANLHSLEGILGDASPDVFGMQETNSAQLFSQGRDVAAFVATRFYGTYTVFSGVAGRSESLDCLIGARARLHSPSARTLPSSGDRDAIPRPLCRGTLRINGTDVLVLVVHIELQEWDGVSASKQVAYAAAVAQAFGGPVLLMGDFNAQMDASSMKALDAVGLRNVWRELRRGQPYVTLPDEGTGIDHIYYRGLVPVGVDVLSQLGGGASDHYPVLASFVLPRGNITAM
eukprot:m51a1_g2890 hypothetical protein (769) ;mRNA; r:424569-427424